MVNKFRGDSCLAIVPAVATILALADAQPSFAKVPQESSFVSRAVNIKTADGQLRVTVEWAGKPPLFHGHVTGHLKARIGALPLNKCVKAIAWEDGLPANLGIACGSEERPISLSFNNKKQVLVEMCSVDEQLSGNFVKDSCSGRK